MQTLTEYGILLSNDEGYEMAKIKLDKLGYVLKNNFAKKNALHSLRLPGENDNLFFTCCIRNGVVRFGVYDYQCKKLSRFCKSSAINKMNEKYIITLHSRLDNSSKKKMHIPPLEELWELSIEQEKLFTDKNNTTYLYDPHLLDVSIEQLQNEEEKTIRL